jgi:diguanylate cyclase (GGDEF)-like protein
MLPGQRAIRADLHRRAFASPPTSALAAMFLGGCVSLILGAAFPLSPLAPVHYYEVSATVCLVASPILFFFGERWSGVVLPIGILGAIVLLSITVAIARTSDGTALCAFAFQWLAVFLAYFLPWRIAATYMALAMVALNIALVENATHWERHARVVITGSFVAIFALLAHLVYRLRVQATKDHLTGLLNRTGLIERARTEVPKALRQGQSVTLCAIDLDDFKSVNDEVGHLGADRLLVDLAAHWRTVLNDRAILARYGGDEFIMICCDLGADGIDAVLDEMREESPLAWSAGYAPLDDVATIDLSIGIADRMLYRMKSERRTASGQ